MSECTISGFVVVKLTGVNGLLNVSILSQISPLNKICNRSFNDNSQHVTTSPFWLLFLNAGNGVYCGWFSANITFASLKCFDLIVINLSLSTVFWLFQQWL